MSGSADYLAEVIGLLVLLQVGESADYLAEVIWFCCRWVNQLITWLKLFGSVAGG